MRKLPLLLFVPLFLMGCASGANTGDQMAISDDQSMTETAEETRLADDVGKDDDWTDTPEEAPAGPDMPAPLTLETVAQNNSEESCWSVINGSVYDLTEWISQHPGGASRILGLCGTDGTSAFQGQHGGSTNPESTLERFLLGGLDN